MGSFDQVPGELDIEIIKGDDLLIGLNFGMDLTGYTFMAVVQTTFPGVPLTVSVVDQTAGSVNIVLSNSITSLMVTGTYNWNFKWTAPGAINRTVLAGTFQVS